MTETKKNKALRMKERKKNQTKTLVNGIMGFGSHTCAN